MGVLFSTLLQGLFGKKDKKILMTGLDAAGKTTILYRLKLGKFVNTIPTIGFDVETLEYKNIRFIFWDGDLWGRNRIRKSPQSYQRTEIRRCIPPDFCSLQSYYENTSGVIFVVDSSDRERIEEAREELSLILAKDELRNSVLLILANKQDVPNAMNTAELTDKLGLNLLTSRDWYVQSASATTGDGLYEGLDWLSNQLNIQ